ncbi:CDGSH iron-sulfur domain-containing protein [Thermus antranikianii]|uniref:CDGSH iron-sulfur domain-containing protein n=1 Tax=Thermus antranikianii TaxID=88190 RepID=A0ABY7RND1_9DEIN|nr:CDGSH iron-sulfur domain-containing protein [Thermus antranikianii]QWK22142.1 MAG: CDGSH iron-sulfur domain-containing protein [Thermus antranikianii]WCM39204.1 CDGSH iron-sulfur domain-containing protein [Thermus antranikianii]
MKLRFRQDGPYVMDLPEGTPFRLNGEERRLERAKLALCRCGHSRNKPFCDGSHKEVGFQAEKGELEMEKP